MKKSNTQRIFNIFIAVVIVQLFIYISSNKGINDRKQDNGQENTGFRNEVIQKKNNNNSKQEQVNLRYDIGWATWNALQKDTLLKEKVKYLISQTL